jgi:hypothetical protein
MAPQKTVLVNDFAEYNPKNASAPIFNYHLQYNYISKLLLVVPKETTLSILSISANRTYVVEAAT